MIAYCGIKPLSFLIFCGKFETVLPLKGIRVLPPRVLLIETLIDKGFFTLYFSTLALRFRACAAFCFRDTCFLHSPQYFELLDVD